MATIDLVMSADTMFISDNATTNYDTSTAIDIGEINTSVSIRRGWIKPSFSGLPVGAVFTSAILKLTPTLSNSSNARTLYAHRCLRDVVSSEATWTRWKVANNWGTAGASRSGTDYDATELGSMTQPASPTLNTPLSLTLSATEIQKLYDGTYTNNGIVLFVDTQLNDMIRYASTENATAAYRPIITVTYELGSGNFFLFF